MNTSRKILLATELGKVMHEFRNQIRQIIQLRIREHSINITFEMLEVMSCLWKSDGINQQEIADLTLRDKSSMTYLIDNLVKREMVKRIEDENDRRNKLIYLTEKGNQLKEQLNPWLNEAYEAATIDIEEISVQSSLDTFKKMAGNLQKAKLDTLINN